MTTIVGIICFVSGLYAGKKRAKGLGWGEIVRDLCLDAHGMASKVFAAVSAPFRKESETQEGLDAPND